MNQDQDRRGSQGRRTARQPDFSLTPEELREVTAFALAAAAEVLPLFEAACPDDQRPRLAIEASRQFVDGAPRSRAQRITAPAAHRAAKEAQTRVAFHAAMAAGDAAASAYLHPLADVAQVDHILRSTAHAARATELSHQDNPSAGEETLERARRRASAVLIPVLGRYPLTRKGSQRVSQLTHRLDVALRDNAQIVSVGPNPRLG